MSDEFDLDAIEALNIAYADDFARMKKWDHAEMHDPLQDLDSFFKHINGNRMLDVGCGWARYVHLFLERGLHYLGIDGSQEMLVAARERHPELCFQQMSFRKLSFPDKFFDGLWCCCVFIGEPKNNMPNVLREMHRVLVQGGVMSVILPAVNESGEEMIFDNDDKTPLLWGVDYDLEELKELMKEAEFEVVESHSRYYNGAQSVLVRK